MKVYESIALNVKNQEPILVTRTGVPYEENGFQMKSGADVGMLELKNLNASVVEELRELDGEFKKSSNSVIDAHGGRRPLVLSELTTNELSTEKIANYFVETLGNPLLSREDNLKLLRRSGVEPNEKSLWAILDRGAKVQARREEGDDAKSGVDVARWALLSDAEEAFGT